MIDENNMAMLSKVMPSLMYVEVQGIPMNDNPGYILLGSPVPKAAEAAPQPLPEPVKPPKAKGKRKAK
jgi:hypothetical protein